MRYKTSKPFPITNALRARLLLWAQQFEHVAWYDSNDHQDDLSEYDALLAVDVSEVSKANIPNAFASFEEFQSTHNDWLFGYFSYDLKNEIESLQSKRNDLMEFPDLYFFRPKRVLYWKEDQLFFEYLEGDEGMINSDWQAIQNTTVPEDFFATENTHPVALRLRTEKEQYFEKFNTLHDHIQRGDIYEVNFCQEFYAEGQPIDPVKTYWHLNEISKPPFASFLRLQEKFVLSASPERFLKKKAQHLWSQPIKGTAPRSSDEKQDQIFKKQLESNPKERSENIMIVDLVRNDLSRIATQNSVKVLDLCDIRSYSQVHQMVSTIACDLTPDVSSVAAIRAAFPMGSMTGAPKIAAMQCIEAVEDAKRGVYSGAVGYFTPENDFDFNVVIRTILYDASKHCISFSVGGAITIQANATDEYLECLLKAKAMRQVLEA